PRTENARRFGMRPRAICQLVVSAVILAGMGTTGIPGAARAAADQAKLAKVLGGPADRWTITPADYKGSGEPALVPGVAAGLTIQRKASQAAPREFFFAFRLKPVKGGSASINLQMASGVRPDKAVQSLNFSVSKTSETPYLSYTTSVQGGKPPPAQTGAQ